MKIFFLMSALSLSLIANGLYAQGAYVSLNAGYGLGSSSSSGYQNTTSGSNSTTTENVNLSLGNGLNIGGAYGYLVNKNIGLELGLSYLMGGTTSTSSTSTSSTSIVDYSAGMLRFNPSIVVASGLDGINPYAKFGAIVGIGSVVENYKYTSTSGSTTTVNTAKQLLNGDLALGLTASLGVLYKINEKISLFGELALVSLSYAPSNGEITAYTINGVDKLSTLKTNQKQTNFVDKITTTTTSAPDTQPSQELKVKYPFGSFGLNIGLRYNL